MSDLTSYELADGVARITLDDGKVNALSEAMLDSIGEQLDRAESDEAVVVLTGRAETFSAGFDLRTAPEGWPAMLVAGATIGRRLMSFPQPVVIACNGNAIAMGGFLLLCADHRIGVEGEYRIGLNEVAIGLTMPWFGVAIANHRLTRPYLDRCTITGELLGPGEAERAGFLDRVVEPAALSDAATEAASALAGIDRAAHAATKLRIRSDAIAGIGEGIDRIRDSEPSEW